MSQKLLVRGLLGNGNSVVIGLPNSFDLHRELIRATEIRLATAFAHWSGWILLRHSLKQSKASTKLLTGLAFCQSEPKVLQEWWSLSKSDRIRARLFANKQTTFHPKVLIVKTPTSEFAVIGSGNLSAGGLRNNVECNYFTGAPADLLQVTSWFDEIFEDDFEAKDLNDTDIRRYRPRYEKAKKSRNALKELQVQAEEDIGDRHRTGLLRWNQAVAHSRRFFTSKRFMNDYREERANVGREIKSALDYPNFDFDRDGFDKFYKILALGHLIEINKDKVWKQRTKLRRMLRLLIDDSIPIGKRLSQILDKDARMKVPGVGLNFVTKVLAVHSPMEFTVHNAPVADVLKHFEYSAPRGYTTSQKYLAFSKLMQTFLAQSAAGNTLQLDAFFFDYWDRFIKPIKDESK